MLQLCVLVRQQFPLVLLLLLLLLLPPCTHRSRQSFPGGVRWRS